MVAEVLFEEAHALGCVYPGWSPWNWRLQRLGGITQWVGNSGSLLRLPLAFNRKQHRFLGEHFQEENFSEIYDNQNCFNDKPSRPLCAFQVTCVSPMWDGIHSHHNRDVDIYIRTSTGSDQVLVTVRRASPAYSRLQTCSLSHPPPPCWLSSLRSLPLCLSYCIPDR